MTKGKFQLSPFLTQLKKKEYGCDCHFATTKKNPRLMEIKVTVFMEKKNDGKHKKYVWFVNKLGTMKVHKEEGANLEDKSMTRNKTLKKRNGVHILKLRNQTFG